MVLKSDGVINKQGDSFVLTGLEFSPAPTKAALQHLVNHPEDVDGTKGEQIRITGSSLTQQTLEIMPKIAEVDGVLSRQVAPQIREVHPEICFWALNGGNPIVSSKRTQAGREARTVVLEGVGVPARAIFDEAFKAFRRREVRRDDILDALAAAVTAYRGQPNHLNTLPEAPLPNEANLPIRDEQADLPMEMVFWKPQP